MKKKAKTSKAKPAKPSAETKRQVRKILRFLEKEYPDAHCALTHKNPFELLMATILSAQCTDVRVNMATPSLFKKYPTPQKLAKAKQEDVEEIVRSLGFFRSKAKSLIEASKDIVALHKGEVPQTMEDLVQLRGAGRKTANVVLGNAFDINEGVVVDTHVGRLSRRFGFTKEKDPVKVERDLIELIPQKKWTIYSHWLISHGRAVCKSQNPKCENCKMTGLCPSALF